MNSFKTFNLSIGTVILRFYLMMGVVIVAGFSGYWLVALLALPIFLSIMMGISFTANTKAEISEDNKTIKNTSLRSASKANLPNVA